MSQHEAPPRILIVDDEPAIAATLMYSLGAEGYATEHEILGRAALARLASGDFALAILDVGLPDGSGFDVCRELRRFSDLPVIFLTARGDEIDRVVGLELGADDYVTKPFSPREVAARVRGILRRLGRSPLAASAPAKAPDTAAPLFELDAAVGRIRCRGHILDLTRYEYLLLKLLIEHPDRIFTRDHILERVWTEPEAVFDRTVDTHIKTLRAKLRALSPAQDPIRTHRGLGYSLSLEEPP